MKTLCYYVRVKGFSFRPKYVLRFLILLQNAVWTSFFSFMEKRHFKKKIDVLTLPEDPLIIIGSWRSGTTYLHELLKHDPNGATPTMYHVHLPEGFLFADSFYRTMMDFFMGKNTRRPFDNMTFHANSPQ